MFYSFCTSILLFIFSSFQYLLRTSKGLKAVAHLPTTSIEPSCTPNSVFLGLGIRACLDLIPFRSIELGTRAVYPMTVRIVELRNFKQTSKVDITNEYIYS